MYDEGRGSRSTGKERDSESGLDYFGARYYGSALGRFTSPDYSEVPTGLPFVTISDPQTLNFYTYVRNNPLSDDDPSGHDSCKAAAGGDTNKCLACNGVVSQLTGITVQAVKDTVVGGAKKLVNTYNGLTNAVNGPIDAALSHFTSFQFGHTAKDLTPSTPGEGSSMMTLAVIGAIGLRKPLLAWRSH